LAASKPNPILLGRNEQYHEEIKPQKVKIIYSISGRNKNILFSTAYRQVVESTQPLIYRLQGVVSQVKAGNSVLSSAQAKNALSYTSALSLTRHVLMVSYAQT
jgi:hypothetical protein